MIPSQGEDITEWVIFFLSCLLNVQQSLMLKLEAHGTAQTMSPKEKQLLYIIESNPGIKTSDIARKLGVSNSTVKRMLEQFINAKLIERHGAGPGSYYTPL